jgi:hypothetical protein
MDIQTNEILKREVIKVKDVPLEIQAISLSLENASTLFGSGEIVIV